MADSPGQVSGHAELAASVAGDLTAASTACSPASSRPRQRADTSAWLELLRARSRRGGRDATPSCCAADTDPIHPARIYGELLPRLADDSVVIGDGGDFVSFAGKYVEPAVPGGWLDPGPYGCLGAGLGAAIAARIARPSAQVVLLLGDGAAGMSLMDVDTLVRHDLPVVMIVGNNSALGAGEGPDADAVRLPRGRRPGARHPLRRRGQSARRRRRDGDRPRRIGPALDRAFAASGPYLVNVLTDPEVAYPRKTTGV